MATDDGVRSGSRLCRPGGSRCRPGGRATRIGGRGTQGGDVPAVERRAARRRGSTMIGVTSATTNGMVPGPNLDEDDPTFAPLRPRLFGIAYRVLGSSAEAEDVVQETWLRWQACDHNAVRNPAAFLGTTATRLALNVAQSARSRRETYVGQWLPEPVDTHDDPALGAERSEALELALLLLLVKLKPRERAVYVLSEAFDYSYAQIAKMLGITEANARQLASRARKFLGGERRRAVSSEEHRRLFDASWLPRALVIARLSRNDAPSGPSWSDRYCASASNIR